MALTCPLDEPAVSSVEPAPGSAPGSTGPSDPPRPVGRPITARRNLWWFNWTTVRGAALLLAGVLILVSPDRERTFSTVAAALLVVWALAELWRSLGRPRREDVSAGSPGGGDGEGGTVGDGSEVVPAPVVAGVAVDGDSVGVRLWVRVARSVVAVGFIVGAVLLVLDEIGFSLVLGALFLLQGLSLLVITLRHHGPPLQRKDHLVSGIVLVALGAVTFLVPETAVLAIRAGLGVGAMALGGVLMAMGLRRSRGEVRVRFDRTSAPRLVNDWLLRRRLNVENRGELVETLFFEPPKKVAKLTSFWVMMVLATGIATFAVIQDSTAVVIGAMLVAPLMTPIMGVAAAAVNGWAVRLVRSVVLVVVAAGAAVLVAWLISSWLPSVGDITANSQISSRVEPALLDFCIAVFAGAAGAYATVDPRVSSSLSGVAIAVALVPPLSVVGITLQQRAWEDAIGASLLFLTNFVSIVLAAVTVFVLMGFAVLPPNEDQRSRMRRVIGVFAAGAMIILVPLSFTSQDIWAESSDEAQATEAVKAWLPEDGSVQLVSVEAEGQTLEVVLTGPALPKDTSILEDDLEERLGYRPQTTLRNVTSEVVELN